MNESSFQTFFRILFNSAEERDADVTELDIEIRLVQICRGFSLSS